MTTKRAERGVGMQKGERPQSGSIDRPIIEYDNCDETSLGINRKRNTATHNALVVHIKFQRKTAITRDGKRGSIHWLEMEKGKTRRDVRSRTSCLLCKRLAKQHA
jgi:hypothetical protein